MARPATRGIFPLAAAGFVLAAVAGATTGTTAGFREPAAGSVLWPESTVSISWQLPDSAASATEMEIVLSLDGGKTFPVRATRDLTRNPSRVAWRVPALATRTARLGLRAGDGEEVERIVLVSEEFAIEADPRSRVEPLFRIGGEWRTEAAVERRSVAREFPPALASSAVPETVRALLRTLPASLRRDPFSDSRPSLARSNAVQAPAGPPFALPPPRIAFVPELPLRI